MNPIRPAATRSTIIFKKEELLLKNNMKNYKSIDSMTSVHGPGRSICTVGSSSELAMQKLSKVDELQESDNQEEDQQSMENSKQKLMSAKLENNYVARDKLESLRDAVENIEGKKLKCSSVLPTEKGKAKCLKQKSNTLEGKLSRQLSLGTGFSKWNKENGIKRPNVLERSGASFGGFSSSNGNGNGKGLMKDQNYTLFRTKSGNALQQQGGRRMEELERQDHNNNQQSRVHVKLPAGRYFDALKGPELDVLKDYEDTLLPLDKKWPFLLRFPIGCFGMCLGLSSQAILWKAFSKTSFLKFLHPPAVILNLALWFLGLSALVIIFITYSLKCMFYFEAVKREYYHPVRVNFFFAPWIVCMFLTLGVPVTIAKSIHPALWCIFMAPVFILELKIYGQWLSGGKRRLSKVANPSSHLSVVGNFVGALLAANVGWKEPAKFFWAVGLGHYLVLFVTLYQRLPTSEALPQELHPVFFLFIAAPCTASVAWEAIYGQFDSVSRIAYFIALFLYTSLVVRINFFRGFRFSVAWWAYTFPMTAASVATIKYSETVKCTATIALALVLSIISFTTVLILFVATLLHAIWGSLFPNDLAIAITDHKRHKSKALKENKKKAAISDFEQLQHASAIHQAKEMLTMRSQQTNVAVHSENQKLP